MDYKELLTKYMKVIGMCEGTYFTDHIDQFSDIKFSDEEIKELQDMTIDINTEYDICKVAIDEIKKYYK